MKKLFSLLKHPGFFMAIWLHTCISFIIAQERGVDFLSILTDPRRLLIVGGIGWLTGLALADTRRHKQEIN